MTVSSLGAQQQLEEPSSYQYDHTLQAGVLPPPHQDIASSYPADPIDDDLANLCGDFGPDEVWNLKNCDFLPLDPVLSTKLPLIDI